MRDDVECNGCSVEIHQMCKNVSNYPVTLSYKWKLSSVLTSDGSEEASILNDLHRGRHL